MKRAYKLLSYEDRKRIEAMWREGVRSRIIAEKIGINTATLYTELRRGRSEERKDVYRQEYDADLAQKRVQAGMERRGHKKNCAKEDAAV